MGSRDDASLVFTSFEVRVWEEEEYFAELKNRQYHCVYTGLKDRDVPGLFERSSEETSLRLHAPR